MNVKNGDSRLPETPPPEKRLIPEPVILVLMIVLIAAVVYVYYDEMQNEKVVLTELKRIAERVEGLENEGKLVESSLSGRITGIKEELGLARSEFNDAKKEIRNSITKSTAGRERPRAGEEREYYEFSFSKKDQTIQVGDVRLTLTDTDPGNGCLGLKIFFDDSGVEKKNLGIHEPVQFIAEQNRVRYEGVVRWIEKDKAGGYLAVLKHSPGTTPQ